MSSSIESNLREKFKGFNEDFMMDLSIDFSNEIVGIRTKKYKYIATITHYELNDSKVLTDYYPFILESKIFDYVDKLQIKYFKYVQKELIAQTQTEAEKSADTAKLRLKEFENILLHTLNINDEVDWESLKNKTEFFPKNPIQLLDLNIEKIVKTRKLSATPIEQNFKAKLNILDYLIPALKNKKNTKAQNDFTEALINWEKEKNEIELEEVEYQKKVKETQLKFSKLESEWKKERENYYLERDKENKEIDDLKIKYSNGDVLAVEEYCNIVLNKSIYPEDLPQTFKLLYKAENKLLVIDYDLPSIDLIPKIKDVKFISKEVREVLLSESERTLLFDSTLYRICLRTIHEIFESDSYSHVESICFNGWVNALDKAKGHMVYSCIMSIQTEKDEFMAINLSKIDEKACFKSLKGVGSSKLSGISAIQPIIMVDRADRRFVDHYSVTDDLSESTNLASMDWEDFENLIREVFEREFQSNGGEVKVTQASRDGGVDAIAFDPDPIRGGKIIIQAKRYTNTVGVSAVRDLYGTVTHEGATKGILVTTADYGPDAYSFANGKPITLLNGGNLLHLLEKHGFKAKIDIAEARSNFNPK
jgi:restriction system protein